MKSCIRCGSSKPITEFYTHPQMGDGHLNKCKDCTKSDTKKRYARLLSTPEGINSERARSRDKYYRLNYKDKYKPTAERKRIIISRYKEKYPEKQKAKNLCSSIRPVVKGNQLHHWSYKIEHAKDVVELTVKDHNLAHRFLEYDKSTYLYKTTEGILLKSKDEHMEYLLSVGVSIKNLIPF